MMWRQGAPLISSHLLVVDDVRMRHKEGNPLKWNEKKKGWMTESQADCHYHNHGGIDVAIRQVVLLCHLYMLHTCIREQEMPLECKPLLLVSRLLSLVGMFSARKISWLYRMQMFNKWCCYLSFFPISDTGKTEIGKQIGCGQKLHKWVNIHMIFFWLCVACPI